MEDCCNDGMLHPFTLLTSLVGFMLTFRVETKMRQVGTEGRLFYEEKEMNYNGVIRDWIVARAVFAKLVCSYFGNKGTPAHYLLPQ